MCPSAELAGQRAGDSVKTAQLQSGWNRRAPWKWRGCAREPLPLVRVCLRWSCDGVRHSVLCVGPQHRDTWNLIQGWGKWFSELEGPLAADSVLQAPN